MGVASISKKHSGLPYCDLKRVETYNYCELRSSRVPAASPRTVVNKIMPRANSDQFKGSFNMRFHDVVFGKNCEVGEHLDFAKTFGASTYQAKSSY